jgi:hypothetical protein
VGVAGGVSLEVSLLDRRLGSELLAEVLDRRTLEP